ncbi:MAG: sensor histidine kinase [Acidimicrobiales bacterium]
MSSGRRPIHIRVAIAALVLLVTLVATLGAWQVVAARNSQRSEIENGEVTAAHLASSALASGLASRLELVSNLAGQPGVSNLFNPKSRSQLPKIAAALHLLYPDFASFGIISAAGKLEARWPSVPSVIGKDVSRQSYFLAVMRTKKPYISGALQQTASPRELVVALATPVRNARGQVVGIIQGMLAASTLGSIIGGTSLRGGGALVIVDQQGHTLSGPAAGAVNIFASMPFVAKALRGRTGAGDGSVPGFSGARLVGYAPIPSTGWAVIAEAPSSTLDAPVTALTERLVAIGLLVLALVIGTMILVALLLRRLAREHQQAGAVLASVGEGVASLGPTGQLLRVNPALEHLTGHRAKELEGRLWSEAFPLYDQQGTPIAWEESIVAEAIRERRVVASSGYSLHLAQSDGRRVPIAVTAAPLATGAELDGAVVVVRDVSHEREVDQLKSSLVSTVSHELRTPLTMIQGFSELLLTRDDLGAVRSRESLQQIHASSQRLGRLIDDLLSVSRIESGKLTVDLAPVDLSGVVAEVLSPFEAQNGRHFVTELDPSLGPVFADRDKTVQALTNLISNAVKYSPESSRIQILTRSAGDHAEISVADEGIGMTAEEGVGVFEKFSRLDHPQVRKVGGTGLGLYITKSLVELQHGQLWVRSEPGRGSTFAFSLPLAHVDAIANGKGDHL